MSSDKYFLKASMILTTLVCAGLLFIWYIVHFADLARAANVATVMLDVIVGISVLFIWVQLRQQAKLTKFANTQALVDLSAPFSMQLIQDRETAELWVKGAHDYEHYDEVDKHRYKMLLYWWLIFHENVYYQRQNDLLDKHIYASWAYDLRTFVSQQNLKTHWGGLRASFQPEFCAYMDRIIGTKSAAPGQQA